MHIIGSNERVSRHLNQKHLLLHMKQTHLVFHKQSDTNPQYVGDGVQAHISAAIRGIDMKTAWVWYRVQFNSTKTMLTTCLYLTPGMHDVASGYGIVRCSIKSHDVELYHSRYHRLRVWYSETIFQMPLNLLHSLQVSLNTQDMIAII